MGDLKVTYSPAIYELFYEKVITEIIEVSERKKKDKSQSTILLSFTHHPDFMWYFGNSPIFEYCSGQRKRGRGRDFRVTSDTARGSVTWAEPLALFR